MNNSHFLAKSILIIFFSVLTFTLIFSSCSYDSLEDINKNENDCDTLTVSYSKHIAPIFDNNCNSCHSGSSAVGRIQTDNYSSVKNNFNSILAAIEHRDGILPMPQGASKLSDCDINKIKRWNNLGKPEN